MIHIGQRIRVKDQDITGEVVRYDGSKLVVLDDDRAVWAEESEEGVLIFRIDEVDPICFVCGAPACHHT